MSQHPLSVLQQFELFSVAVQYNNVSVALFLAESQLLLPEQIEAGTQVVISNIAVNALHTGLILALRSHSYPLVEQLLRAGVIPRNLTQVVVQTCMNDWKVSDSSVDIQVHYSLRNRMDYSS